MQQLCKLVQTCATVVQACANVLQTFANESTAEDEDEDDDEDEEDEDEEPSGSSRLAFWPNFPVQAKYLFRCCGRPCIVKVRAAMKRVWLEPKWLRGFCSQAPCKLLADSILAASTFSLIEAEPLILYS